ncbi:hypothetical protein ACWEQG_21135 [Microbispora sp. NPDC004025]
MWVPWDGTGAINFTAGGKKYDFYQKQGWITGTIDGVSHAFIQQGGRIFIAFAADGRPFFGKVPSRTPGPAGTRAPPGILRRGRVGLTRTSPGSILVWLVGGWSAARAALAAG